MFGSDFISLFNSLLYTARYGLEDFADRLNLFTVVLFSISAVIVTTNQYILNPISCYVPVQPDVKDFEKFLTDYCWVHGTIPLRSNERMPTTGEEWKLYDKFRRITYYQWIPFMIALQCILFFLPHLMWQSLSSIGSGGDMFDLVKIASEASISDRDDRESMAARITEFLEDMIETYKYDFKKRNSKLAQTTIGIFKSMNRKRRMGVGLVISYFFIKLIIIMNAIAQLLLIQYFLGLDGWWTGNESNELDQNWRKDKSSKSKENYSLNMFNFGIKLANHIRSGREWPETLIFPRVAYCRVADIRLIGAVNSYTAQCTLPINMLNEKLYIFFWFWITFLIGACIFSLILWLMRMICQSGRKDFIKRYLRIKMARSAEKQNLIQRADLDHFVDNYLRHDGLFLLRMLMINAGDVVTSEIVVNLYNHFQSKHYGAATLQPET